MTDICAICGQPLGGVRISFTSGEPAEWLHPDCAKFDPDMTTAHIRGLMGKIEMLRDRLEVAERLLKKVPHNILLKIARDNGVDIDVWLSGTADRETGNE